MKIALILETVPGHGETPVVSARVLITDETELAAHQSQNIFQTIELTPEQEIVVRNVFWNAPADSLEQFNQMMGGVALAAYNKGRLRGRNEKSLEHREKV